MKRSAAVGLVGLALALASAGCAKSKPSDAAPAASATASVSAPLEAGALAPNGAAPPAPRKVCSDGFHQPGDHWKEACNPCRCAMDGEITCAHFPCPATAAAEGGAPDAGVRRDAGTAP